MKISVKRGRRWMLLFLLLYIAAAPLPAYSISPDEQFWREWWRRMNWYQGPPGRGFGNPCKGPGYIDPALWKPMMPPPTRHTLNDFLPPPTNSGISPVPPDNSGIDLEQFKPKPVPPPKPVPLKPGQIMGIDSGLSVKPPDSCDPGEYWKNHRALIEREWLDDRTLRIVCRDPVTRKIIPGGIGVVRLPGPPARPSWLRQPAVGSGLMTGCSFIAGAAMNYLHARLLDCARKAYSSGDSSDPLYGLGEAQTNVDRQHQYWRERIEHGSFWEGYFAGWCLMGDSAAF